MVRPKKKDGRQIQLYLSNQAIEMINTARKNISMSDFVEMAVRWVVEGHKYAMQVEQERIELQIKVKNLEAMNQELQKQLDKMTKELAELKAKWGNQMQISEVSKDALLAERIAMLAREGVIIGDVLEELGIIGMPEQLKVIKRIFRERDADTWESYYGPLRGWVLKRTGDGPLTEFMFQEQREVEVVGVQRV